MTRLERLLYLDKIMEVLEEDTRKWTEIVGENPTKEVFETIASHDGAYQEALEVFCEILIEYQGV